MIKKVNNITLNLRPDQVEALVDKLPTKNKIRLFKKLEQETWAQRLDKTVTRIRKRLKKNPLSQKEINRICEEARQQTYNERTKSRH